MTFNYGIITEPMRSIIVPFGKTGWEEKKLLLEEVIASRPHPPHVYNDVLILVPSSRLKRVYGRIFLDALERMTGARALVQPDIQTLHQFLQRQYPRLHGPRLLDENSRLVLLEGLVKERLARDARFNPSPDLLAPSLSSALAKMIEQLSAAGVSPADLTLRIQGSDFSDKPQVSLLIDVYDRYEKALRDADLTDPAGMRVILRDRFDPAWLSHYGAIIIDGIQDATKTEADILGKVAACGECTYVVEAPSSSLLNRAGDLHPLGITREFLSGIGIMPDHGGSAEGSDDLYLASALFSDKPFAEIAAQAPDPSSFSKKISLLSAVNTREEVSLIAGAVKKSLKSGTVPDSILVAFPALDDYGPLVEEIFTDYGIPYNRALGRQLGTSPIATAVISLLHSCQEDFSGPSLLRVFNSPFLKFSESPMIAPTLDRLMRSRKVTGGRQTLLSALSHQTTGVRGRDILTAPVKDLFTALAPFSERDAAPLSRWMERLSALLAWSGLGARVELIKGPLNINLQAYKKLNETMTSLAQAGTTFPDFRYTFNEWLFLLKKTFLHARYQVPPEDEGGVQILGLEESLSHAWEEIYLGGLVDGRFPQRLPQNIFLPERTLEAMGVRTLERARLKAAFHFYRLLLSADKVTLTYPENEGDRPAVPAPFLEELTPLKKAGLLKTTSAIQFSLKIEDSSSMPELAKAISLAGDRKGLPNLLSADIEGIAGIRSAVGYKPAASLPVLAPAAKRDFRVTELDAYLSCPYDYYVTTVLGIEPLEEVTEDLSPLDRGSKVHAILRNFYLAWTRPVAREHRDEARALLRKLADSAFDTEADTFRNRREKDLFLTVMVERFLDAEEEFWKQGMKPAYLEQKIEHYRLLLASGAEAGLSARIDRIDVDEHGNFMIVDYKTGKYPLPKMNGDQDIFQLPVYAVMAQQALLDTKPALKKPIGLVYYDLAGKTGAGARDVVLFDRDARDDHPSSRPKASPRSARDFEALLAQSMDKARQAVEAILSGSFPGTPRDANKCRYCPNEMMCGSAE